MPGASMREGAVNLTEKIRSKAWLKKLVLWSLMPRRRATPRKWVRFFLNPFFHKRGKGSFVSPKARLDVLPFHEFSVGENAVIEDFVTINNGVGDVFIGSTAMVGIGSTVIGPVRIGRDVLIGQGVVLSGLNHVYEDIQLPIEKQPVTKKTITVEDEVLIGANTSIVSGVTIGKHAVIGAGSVVTKDVAAYTVVAGNPAKMIKRYEFETKKWERVK